MPAGRSLRTFDSLSVPQFRWFFLALLGQMGAMNMQMLIRGYLAFELTDSHIALGTVAMVGAIPMLFLSPFGGVLADRLPKKRVLQTGQSASAAVAVVVGLLLVFDLLRFEHLLVASVFQGTIMGMMMPSRQAMLPEVVGMGRLMNAVSLTAAGMNTMRLGAPAAGGFLIAFVGPEFVYFIMAGMFLFAVVTLTRVNGTPARLAGEKVSFRQVGLDLREGVSYIADSRVLSLLLLMSFITSALAMPYLFMLPGFVDEVFDGGAIELGLLIAVGGVGSLVGSLVLASLPERRRGMLLMGSALVIGIALLAFAASPSVWIGGIFMVFVGVGSAGRQALGNVLLQSNADNEHRGRVMSIYMTQFSLMSIGAFGIGVVAEWIGPEWALGGMAAALVIVTTAFMALSPTMRRLD